MMTSKRLELDWELDVIQATELEIKSLEGELEVLKHKRDDRVKKELIEMVKDFEEKQGKTEVLEALNEELYNDRQKLILVFFFFFHVYFYVFAKMVFFFFFFPMMNHVIFPYLRLMY